MTARSQIRGHAPAVTVRPAGEVIEDLVRANADQLEKIRELREDRRQLERAIGVICETMDDRRLAQRIMDEFQWSGRQKLMRLGMEP